MLESKKPSKYPLKQDNFINYKTYFLTISYDKIMFNIFEV